MSRRGKRITLGIVLVAATLCIIAALAVQGYFAYRLYSTVRVQLAALAQLDGILAPLLEDGGPAGLSSLEGFDAAAEETGDLELSPLDRALLDDLLGAGGSEELESLLDGLLGRGPAPTPRSSGPQREPPSAEGASRLPGDVLRQGNTFVVLADMPGADPESIDVRARGLSLIINARVAQHALWPQRDAVVRRERRLAPYSRTVVLPAPLAPDTLTTEYAQGVLRIRVAQAGPGV